MDGQQRSKVGQYDHVHTATWGQELEWVLKHLSMAPSEAPAHTSAQILIKPIPCLKRVPLRGFNTVEQWPIRVID